MSYPIGKCGKKWDLEINVSLLETIAPSEGSHCRFGKVPQFPYGTSILCFAELYIRMGKESSPYLPSFPGS